MPNACGGKLAICGGPICGGPICGGAICGGAICGGPICGGCGGNDAEPPKPDGMPNGMPPPQSNWPGGGSCGGGNGGPGIPSLEEPAIPGGG